MIKKLYERGYFDYKSFILDNLKALSLSTTEAIVLIKILDNFKITNIFNHETIRETINIRKDSFENALASLLERKIYEIYLSYDNDIASEAISLDGFFELAEKVIDNKEGFDEDEVHSILMIVSKTLNRMLNSNEIEIIKSLVIEDRYTKDDFETAIANINESKRLINIRNISNELSKEKSSPKVKKETPKYVKDFIKCIK